jgi:hypothetical protein
METTDDYMSKCNVDEAEMIAQFFSYLVLTELELIRLHDEDDWIFDSSTRTPKTSRELAMISRMPNLRSKSVLVTSC